MRATGLPELSTCASAASNSGVIVRVEKVRNSGPYCRQVSAGSLSSALPTKDEQLGRLADDVIDDVRKRREPQAGSPRCLRSEPSAALSQTSFASTERPAGRCEGEGGGDCFFVAWVWWERVDELRLCEIHHLTGSMGMDSLHPSYGSCGGITATIRPCPLRVGCTVTAIRTATMRG